MSAEAAILAALLEAGGPTAVAVAVLWHRMNRLETRVENRLRALSGFGPPAEGREARWSEKWDSATDGGEEPPS